MYVIGIISVCHVLPGERRPGRHQRSRRGGKGVFDQGPILHTSAVIGAGPLTLRQ